MTWHGEGQIVVYPIIMWDSEDEKNVKSVISKLEQWVISAPCNFVESKDTETKECREFGLTNHKICSIGLSFPQVDIKTWFDNKL